MVPPKTGVSSAPSRLASHSAVCYTQAWQDYPVRRIGPFDVCVRLLEVRVLAAVAVAVAACGSQGGGPYGEIPPGLIGFVGSGGGRFDGGRAESDAGVGTTDGATDGATGQDSGPGFPEPIDGSTLEDAGTEDVGPSDAGSSVGIVLNLPPGFFAALNWVIEGPAGSYSGTVHFGGARSIEFVVGGIQAGDGYVITLSGFDAYGQPCSGTSPKFDVSPGATTGAGVLIQCDGGDGATPATISTGNVAIEAGISVTGP
jgi:hypothetical protein